MLYIRYIKSYLYLYNNKLLEGETGKKKNSEKELNVMFSS